MPCRYDGPVESDRTREELDTVTRLLCGLCKIVDPSLLSKVPALKPWWNNHERADKLRHDRENAARFERERVDNLRKSGLQKLSPEEYQALFDEYGDKK